MNNTKDNKLDNILYQITNLPKFKKKAKINYEKYHQIRNNNLTATDINKRNKYYKEYCYYLDKIKETNMMLDILNDNEKELLIDWYTTPKYCRKKADAFASERYMSRTDFFRKKKKALEKLLKHYS